MNPAGRLLAIYDKLVSHGWPADKAMVWIWAEVFEIPHTDQHVEDDVVACLQALRSEIDLLGNKMLSLGGSDDLLYPGLARLRNVASPVYMNSPWAGHSTEVSRPENRIPLQWARWTLRMEDEENMPIEELNRLQNELTSLEQSLQEVEMSPYLRNFVQRQIDVIRLALRISKVRGAAPIEEAIHQVAGTITIQRARIEAENTTASEPAKTVLARASALIKSTADLADNLDKIKKAGQDAYTLAATVGPLLLSWAKS